MEVINPDLKDLQKQVMELRDRLASVEGKYEEVSKTAGSAARQTLWQFVAFTVTMAATLLGSVTYQTSILDKRIEQVERRLDQRVDNVEKRMELMEKNLGQRFEDLRQVVLAAQKNSANK